MNEILKHIRWFIRNRVSLCRRGGSAHWYQASRGLNACCWCGKRLLVFAAAVLLTGCAIFQSNPGAAQYGGLASDVLTAAGTNASAVLEAVEAVWVAAGPQAPAVLAALKDNPEQVWGNVKNEAQPRMWGAQLATYEEWNVDESFREVKVRQ